MIKLHDEFKESGFVILAIDLREKQKTVKKFVEKKKNILSRTSGY